MSQLSLAAQARVALRQLGYDYTDQRAFEEEAYKGDLVLVELFVQAGKDIAYCKSVRDKVVGHYKAADVVKYLDSVIASAG